MPARKFPFFPGAKSTPGSKREAKELKLMGNRVCLQQLIHPPPFLHTVLYILYRHISFFAQSRSVGQGGKVSN